MNSSAQKVCNEIVKEVKKKMATDDCSLVVLQLAV